MAYYSNPKGRTRVYIYALIDPRTKKVRYVGKTQGDSIHQRLIGHLSAARRGGKSPCCRWIAGLTASNLTPIIKELAVVKYSEWKDAERYYIAAYKQRGCDLLNCNRGGAGG